MNNKYNIAHIKEDDLKNKIIQTVEEHCTNVGNLSSNFLQTVNLSNVGNIQGLLHDLGKLRNQFANYIQSAEGIIDQDSDEYIDANQQKGKIDHSTAGAQLIKGILYKHFKNTMPTELLVTLIDIFTLPIVSHHSGLINSSNIEDDSFPLTERLNKSKSKTGLDHVVANLNNEHSYKKKIQDLIQPAVGELSNIINDVTKNSENEEQKNFYLSLLIKLLFSALVDADRIDTAEFMFEPTKLIRMQSNNNYRMG